MGDFHRERCKTVWETWKTKDLTASIFTLKINFKYQTHYYWGTKYLSTLGYHSNIKNSVTLSVFFFLFFFFFLV